MIAFECVEAIIIVIIVGFNQSLEYDMITERNKVFESPQFSFSKLLSQ